MSEHKLPQSVWLPLSFSINRVFQNQEQWLAYLKELGIEKKSHVKTATEGALLGAILASGVSSDLGIVSDGAGQFRLLEHGLCWVDAPRLINKLIPFTRAQRLAVETERGRNLGFLSGLKSLQKIDIQPAATRESQAGTEIRANLHD